MVIQMTKQNLLHLLPTHLHVALAFGKKGASGIVGKSQTHLHLADGTMSLGKLRIWLPQRL